MADSLADLGFKPDSPGSSDSLANLGFKPDAVSSSAHPLASLGFKPDDPIHANPSRPEDLPSRESFDASHAAAVQQHQQTLAAAPAPSFWERVKRVFLG